MKKCILCGAEVDEQETKCPVCGALELTPADDHGEVFQPALQNEPLGEASVSDIPIDPSSITPEEEGSKHGNILMGIIGSFLCSLLGGLLYFGVYQLGFIAGICGLAIFWLAAFGYKKFAKPASDTSVVGIIVAVVVSVVVIYLSEYVCFSYEVYKVLKEYGEISFTEALRAAPVLLEDPEIKNDYTEELALSYFFGALSAIGTFSKSKKNG